ncbi:MAG: flagellar filament capping protein FliD, partial [Schwartzia succinivorans]|nr:flagellar filament capping protein FliD [Schwartzia succinivorans]
MGVNGIYGLSGSGLDVESLVKVGMMSKQSEYDKLYQKTVKQQWTKEALADIYSDLTTFKYTTLSGFKSQSKLNAMAATTTDSTAVTATANGAAIAMNHKVEVTSLSSNAYWMSDGTITRANTTEAGKNSIKLADNVFYSIKDNHNGTFTYKETENGDEIIVNGEDTAIKFTVGDTKDPLTEEQQKKQTISYSFRELAEGKTYNDVAADVNAMGTNIKASYDSVTDSFTFYNSISGSDSGINITLAAADEGTGVDDKHNGGTFAAKLLNNFNLKQSVLDDEGSPTLKPLPGDADNPFVAGEGVETYGTEGSVKIDGKVYDNVKDNRITVSGVTYNLLNAEVGKTTTISVSQDTDAIIDTVKSFVEEYNKVLDKLQEKYSTKTWSTDDLDNDYEPLTKTQQAGMTADQIESWNEKAKSGL